jgi:hypothetical protein
MVTTARVRREVPGYPLLPYESGSERLRVKGIGRTRW